MKGYTVSSFLILPIKNVKDKSIPTITLPSTNRKKKCSLGIKGKPLNGMKIALLRKFLIYSHFLNFIFLLFVLIFLI